MNTKFNYTPISRETIAGKRHYCLPDGSKVASVTTILDKTKPQESVDALNNWRKRVGAQAAQTITTEAAGRGTSMHSHLENYLREGKHALIGTNLVHAQAYKMADVIINDALKYLDEVWGLEVPVYYPGLYAGTTDLVGIYRGIPAIMDYKQTNRPKKIEYVEDYFIQLSAYILAHNTVHGTDIRQGHIFMCSKDLEYQQFDLLPANFSEYEDKWLTRVELYYRQLGALC